MSVHFKSESHEWETPTHIFDKYNAIYNFTCDVAATLENTKVKDNYFTIEENALSKSWNGNCWCNPPYSKVAAWIKKAFEESLSNVTTVMLIPARTDTKAWHSYIFNKSNVRIEFLKGRLKFSNSKNSAPFPSAIIIFYPI